MRQFGSFDGLDNRKTVFALLGKLGGQGSEMEKAFARARFLRNLMALSDTGFSRCPASLSPLSLTDAYFAFTAITGVLGVPIDRAAEILEKAVRKR